MKNPEISIEFFPPQTEKGSAKLITERAKLAALSPTFFSVTYGAGGSTQERTFSIVEEILAEGLPVAPHLSCIGATKDSIKQILERYQSAGIRRIVALRGDLPSGMADCGELRYANELVAFIREQTGDYFHIEVAAYPEWHPQAKNPETDLEHFSRKVKAGANSAITQYFYNADSYFYFLDSAQRLGVDIPIVPGIMPIRNVSKLLRFSESCGAEIPRWMQKCFEGLADDQESIMLFGMDVVTKLCERLIEGGAPGLHFYSMNQSSITLEICQRLGIKQSDQTAL